MIEPRGRQLDISAVATGRNIQGAKLTQVVAGGPMELNIWTRQHIELPHGNGRGL